MLVLPVEITQICYMLNQKSIKRNLTVAVIGATRFPFMRAIRMNYQSHLCAIYGKYYWDSPSSERISNNFFFSLAENKMKIWVGRAGN